jgi:20S proteasome alpha/beta subunit
VTTIAYRDGVLVADSLCTSEGTVVGSAQKALRLGSLLCGAAGAIGVANAFFDWLKAGARDSHPDMGGANGADGTGLVIMPDGLIVTFDKYGVDRIRAPFHAIGSGARIAMGAMAVGATALEAVQAAVALDVWTGGALTEIRRPL